MDVFPLTRRGSGGEMIGELAVDDPVIASFISMSEVFNPNIAGEGDRERCSGTSEGIEMRDESVGEPIMIESSGSSSSSCCRGDAALTDGLDADVPLAVED
jgi:hypothetical protein